MKRTPLQRRTPLKSRPQAAQDARVRPEPVPMDLTAAAAALRRRAESAETPRVYAGPVPDVSQPAPRPASTGFPPVVRQTIIDRDQMRCARCGTPIDVSPIGYSLQHRDNRGMGGTRDRGINLPSNGLTLCGSGTTGCHGWTEAHPDAAERLGYAVQSWADPATVPVYTPTGWVLLSPTGTANPTTEPPGRDAHATARRKENRP